MERNILGRKNVEGIKRGMFQSALQDKGKQKQGKQNNKLGNFMLQGCQKVLAKSRQIWFFSLGFLLINVDLSKMAQGGGAVYVIVVCVVPSVMGRGLNPLGLNCSFVLQFCKAMGFKKRSFRCILLIFCFKRQHLPSSVGYGAGVCL